MELLSVPVMLLYAAFGLSPMTAEVPIIYALLLATLLYMAPFIIFYGIILMSFNRRTWLLWGSILATVIVGHLSGGMANVWTTLTVWSMFLFGGVIAGRMNLSHFAQSRIYLISAAAVAIFFTAWQLPQWPQMMEMWTKGYQVMVQELGGLFKLFGMTEQQVAESQATHAQIVRLLPAFMILSALLQFSVAYMLFLINISRQRTGRLKLEPFRNWKMPFTVAPLILLAMVGHFFGNDTITMIADNILMIFSVYYCLTGLSLIEYLFRRYKLSWLMKTLFYIALVASLAAGYIATVILGFIDSFADWRGKNSSPAVENGAA